MCATELDPEDYEFEELLERVAKEVEGEPLQLTVLVSSYISMDALDQILESPEDREDGLELAACMVNELVELLRSYGYEMATHTLN